MLWFMLCVSLVGFAVWQWIENALNKRVFPRSARHLPHLPRLRSLPAGPLPVEFLLELCDEDHTILHVWVRHATIKPQKLALCLHECVSVEPLYTTMVTYAFRGSHGSVSDLPPDMTRVAIDTRAVSDFVLQAYGAAKWDVVYGTGAGAASALHWLSFDTRARCLILDSPFLGTHWLPERLSCRDRLNAVSAVIPTTVVQKKSQAR